MYVKKYNFLIAENEIKKNSYTTTLLIRKIREFTNTLKKQRIITTRYIYHLYVYVVYIY